MTSRPLRIGVVAGEHSGDILGAKVICKLRERHPDLEIYGPGRALTDPLAAAAGEERGGE